MDKSTPMSLTMALRTFFGFKEGQTLGQFAAEMKELNDADDRAYFRKHLEADGFTITN